MSTVTVQNGSVTCVVFVHNEDTRAYVVKEGQGGINWYNY